METTFEGKTIVAEADNNEPSSSPTYYVNCPLAL